MAIVQGSFSSHLAKEVEKDKHPVISGILMSEQEVILAFMTQLNNINTNISKIKKHLGVL